MIAIPDGAGVSVDIIFIYIICFVISVTLLVVSICTLAKKVIIGSRDSSADAESNMLPVICLLVGSCFFVALPLGFHESLQATGSSFGAALLSVPFGIYDCLSMLLFEGRLDAFYGLLLGFGEAHRGFACCYLFYITCLYVIAPIAIAATAISMFKGRISLLRAIRLIRRQVDCGRVYIFEGVNARSLSFVRDVKKKMLESSAYKVPLVVFAGVSRDDAEKRSGEIRDLTCKSIRFIDASAEFLLAEVFKSLKGRPFKSLHVFFLGDDQGSDLGATISFLRKLAWWTSGFDTSREAFPPAESRLSEVDDAVLSENDAAWQLRFAECGSPRYHVYCACSGRSDEPTLDSMRGVSGIDIRIVDEGREAIYDLLWNHPLHKTLPPHYLLEGIDDCQCKKANLVVVILGAGEYGFEAFRAVSWLGQIVDTKLTLFVIDQMAESEFEDKVDYWCPELRNSNCFPSSCASPDECGGLRQSLRYHQATVGKRDFNATLEEVHRQIVEISNENVAEGLGKVSPYCIVALGNDDLSTDAAISMRQVFCGDGEDAQGLLEPLVYVNIFDYSRHPVIEKMNGTKLPMSLIPFGSIERIFTEDYIVDSPLEALAFSVHSAIMKREDEQAGKQEQVEAEDVKAAMQKQIRNYLRYTEWQMNRLSSAANALSIRSKLWAMGLDMKADKPGELCGESGRGMLETAISQLLAGSKEVLENQDPASRDEFFASDHQLARMARAEHDRWVALYLTEGWTGMTPKASLHFMFRGMNNGRHDSHLLMRHPFIVPFKELGEISKCIGRKDTRLKNVWAIVDLGSILGGSIGYGERKYSISIVPDSDPGLFLVGEASSGSGGVYEKKPGTTGFYAFATDEPSFLFHNVLEDGTEESPGVFMCGLMGEIWRIEKLPGDMTLEQLSGDRYPEKLGMRYVIDGEGEDGRNVTFDDLKVLPAPKDWQESGFSNPQDALRSYRSCEYDFNGCRKVRYRKPGDEKPKTKDGLEKDYPETEYVLAAQADPAWAERCIQGSYTEYWVNRKRNVWGHELNHGNGDRIVCTLVDCTGKELPPNVPLWEMGSEDGSVRTFCPEIFVGKGAKGNKKRPYVINGIVFEKTYQQAQSVKPVNPAEHLARLGEKKR